MLGEKRVRITLKPGEKLSVLVVDDESEIRDMLVTFIEMMEIFDFIVEAQDGSEAIRKTQNQKFDLIITDLMMPQVRGIELVQTIKNQEKRQKGEETTPIIILSGNVTGDEVKKAIHFGIKYVLTKPLTAEDFIKKVNEVLIKERRAKIRVLKDESDE